MDVIEFRRTGDVLNGRAHIIINGVELAHLWRRATRRGATAFLLSEMGGDLEPWGPNGNVTAFLRPEVRPDGALVLASPIGPFGMEGAYLVVARPDRQSGWVRRVRLAQEFVVSVDGEGTGILRADHTLNLWRIPGFQLAFVRPDCKANQISGT